MCARAALHHGSTAAAIPYQRQTVPSAILPNMPTTDAPAPAATSAAPPTPHVPLRSRELPWKSYGHGVRFGGRSLALGKLGGAQLVGVNLDEIAPGKQSCPFHYHQREEEHFFVLQGRCILRSGEQRHEMGPSDYVCFPAGTGVAHCFENPFAEPCVVLTIGTRDNTEGVVYPDSGKVMLKALRSIVALPEQSLDYWDRERTDEPLPSR
jgi:uncharacterized cupin superfamily protein